MNELALFAGAGGGILGGHLLGWRTVCAVERDAYCAAVLAQRQNDGALPPFPIWSDVRTFDGRPWRGRVDVVSGGFPCQDISIAGRGDGLDGERSGLWLEQKRIVREVGPRYVFVENSPMLTARGLDRVLGCLASMGFNARWGVLGADAVGAPQHRERIWILADADDAGRQGAERQGAERQGQPHQARQGRPAARRQPVRPDSRLWPPGPREVDSIPVQLDGMAARMDRLRALGNGQVPAVAATAWRLLSDHFPHGTT